MLATRRRDIAGIAYGFMASKTLFAALEIRLFSLLADGPRTGADLARATGVAANRLTTLLRALVALGLLIADDEGFRNAPAAQRHLVRDAPGDIGEYYRLQIGRQIYPALNHLDAGIAGAGVAFEQNEAPGEELAVIRHSRGGGQDGLELGGRRPWSGHGLCRA